MKELLEPENLLDGELLDFYSFLDYAESSDDDSVMEAIEQSALR